MLCCYVSDHQHNWDEFAETFAYLYNLHVGRATGTRPSYIVLSRPPPEFTPKTTTWKIRKNLTGLQA